MTRFHTRDGGYRTMTLTKDRISDALCKKVPMSKNKAAETVELLLETIKQTLATGEDVMISGFGKFCVKGKRQRRGRNPATGDSMLLSPRRIVTFKCSGKLREKLDQGG